MTVSTPFFPIVEDYVERGYILVEFSHLDHSISRSSCTV